MWFIVQGGWTIWTRFDIEDVREYLDYYAMDRMTGRPARPALCRRRIGGPSYNRGNVRHSRRARRRRKRPRPVPKHFERNQAVEKMLEEKGFVMTDKAHGSAIVNRHLQTHPEAHD